MNELNQQQFIEEEGISLQELFHILWLNRMLIFLVTLWVMVLGVIYTYVIVTPTYTAETSLIVDVDYDATNINEQSAISIAQQLIDTYKEFVLSNLILDSVVEDIDELSANQSLSGLKNSISINTTTRVLIIRISVESESPELAAEIANQLVENSISIANDEENGYILLQNKLKVLDVAEVPTSPSSPNSILNIAISIILGGILSVGFIFVKELFNNKFQKPADMEKYLSIKVIAAVPGTMKERKLVE